MELNDPNNEIKFSCKINNVLRCPYHSWSYNLEGKLVATPHVGGMDKHEAKGFDKSSNTNLAHTPLKELQKYSLLSKNSMFNGLRMYM